MVRADYLDSPRTLLGQLRQSLYSPRSLSVLAESARTRGGSVKYWSYLLWLACRQCNDLTCQQPTWSLYNIPSIIIVSEFGNVKAKAKGWGTVELISLCNSHCNPGGLLIRYSYFDTCHIPHIPTNSPSRLPSFSPSYIHFVHNYRFLCILSLRYILWSCSALSDSVKPHVSQAELILFFLTTDQYPNHSVVTAVLAANHSVNFFFQTVTRESTHSCNACLNASAVHCLCSDDSNRQRPDAAHMATPPRPPHCHLSKSESSSNYEYYIFHPNRASLAMSFISNQIASVEHIHQSKSPVLLSVLKFGQVWFLAKMCQNQTLTGQA
jgi:hypothetical protein